jgi:hypothetical protein
MVLTGSILLWWLAADPGRVWRVSDPLWSRPVDLFLEVADHGWETGWRHQLLPPPAPNAPSWPNTDFCSPIPIRHSTADPLRFRLFPLLFRSLNPLSPSSPPALLVLHAFLGMTVSRIFFALSLAAYAVAQSLLPPPPPPPLAQPTPNTAGLPPCGVG